MPSQNFQRTSEDPDQSNRGSVPFCPMTYDLQVF